MGFLSSFLGNSGDNKEREHSRTNLDPQKMQNGDGSEELVRVMSGKDLDMTASDVRLSTGRTTSHMSVARTELLKTINQALGKVQGDKETLVKKMPAIEEQRIGRELQAAEDDSSKIVKAEIDPDEKIIVSSEILHEASEALARKIKEMFELLDEMGEKDEDVLRKEMIGLWKEVYLIVEQNMEAYYYVKEKSREESGDIQAFTVDSANVFRNTVKVWSRLNRDAADRLKALKKYRIKLSNFDSGNETIFQQFFQQKES